MDLVKYSIIVDSPNGIYPKALTFISKHFLLAAHTVPLPTSDCSDLRLLSNGTAQTVPSPYKLDVDIFQEDLPNLPVTYSYRPSRTYDRKFGFMLLFT